VRRGEILAIVGESGCGKSVSSLAIMRLLPKRTSKVTKGEILFGGRNLLKLSDGEMRRIRGREIGMIFQEPMTSLNPVLTIGDQIMEPLFIHMEMSKTRARERAIELLNLVGITDPERRLEQYPHQMSGGMRQRIMIAIALACEPKLLIADEPTTALDVTIQAQILDLMRDLQRTEGAAILLITHDLGVVAGMCHRVNVMYAGKFVEEARVDELFAQPRHPYTMGLLSSIARLDEVVTDRLTPIPGQPPDVAHLPPGCAFRPRCPFAIEKCAAQYPPLVTSRQGSQFACYVDVTTAPRQEVISG
jgi:oligopeptide/dipeptide ABC transporter ATP-binding protein